MKPQLTHGNQITNPRSRARGTPNPLSTTKKSKTTPTFDYFGACYYSSGLSVWLSLDALADKHPNFTPYAYVYNNPIMFIDLWGLEGIKDPNGNEGNAGTGYKQTADKKYLYGKGLKTKVWDLDYQADEHYGKDGGGMADSYTKGGYVDYNGPDIDFENYGKPNAKKETHSVKNSSKLSTTPWMAYAKNELHKGVSEIRGSAANPDILKYLKSANIKTDSDEKYGWCASYVNWCLQQAGIDGAGARANSYHSWGYKLKEPKYGAIAIFTNSHVGFYVGTKGDNYIILHGNWSDKIQLSDYIKKGQIREFRFPNGY